MIDDLLAARLQMAISLGFHILFAVAGMAMPCLTVLAEWRYYETRDPFGTPDELTHHASIIPGPVTHVWFEGKGHDLKGADQGIVVIP